jgi:hypothetical protein
MVKNNGSSSTHEITYEMYGGNRKKHHEKLMKKSFFSGVRCKKPVRM